MKLNDEANELVSMLAFQLETNRSNFFNRGDKFKNLCDVAIGVIADLAMFRKNSYSWRFARSRGKRLLETIKKEAHK